MLFILNYKTEKVVEYSEEQREIWKRFAPVLYYASKGIEWTVFSDPYSGVFQTRYKADCIWLSRDTFGEGVKAIVKCGTLQVKNFTFATPRLFEGVKFKAIHK